MLNFIGPKIAPEKRWDCFVRAIQTGVIVEAIQGGHPAGWASDIVIEAMVVPPEELPDGWGLLEIHPKTVRCKVDATRFNAYRIVDNERTMLVSLLRRAQKDKEKK